MPRQKVLIVDDNRKNRAIMEELFRDEYEVHHAENGGEALQIMQEINPDVVLLDIMMPGMSGYEVCQKIKSNSRTSSIPVIIISAKGQTEEIVEGFESRADDYIVRPFANSEVRARVRAMLRLKEAQDQLKETNLNLQAHARKLEEANERLNELDRLKAGFTAMLVHDLRSPLAVVQVALQMIEGKGETLGQEYSSLVREAIDSCNGMFNLTNDLLEGFRAESGAMSLNCRRGCVGELVEEPIRHASVLAMKKQIEIHKIVENSALDMVVDFHKLQRAISNLLGNAIKFTRKKGTIHAKVGLNASSLAEEANLFIEVRDSGGGMHPEDIPHIFAPYYQGKSSAGAIGAGLGLFIAKRIVEAHGGNIEVYSELGVGSCFKIVLPLNRICLSADEAKIRQP